MRNLPFAVLLLLPAAAPAQSPAAGAWQIKSTVVELDVAGLPGFVQHMAKGHASTERKCLPPNQSFAVLLAPDPKAQCRIDRAVIADGRYTQTLTCPQKQGTPTTVVRTGTYDGGGFTGRVSLTGSTSKGPMRITLDQRAVRSSGICSGRDRPATP